ncbi:MAG: acyl carrier protein [Bacteroidota bacterium]
MKQIISNYIVENLISKPDIEIGSDDDLLTTGLLDSLSIMKLVGFIEKEFDITIPPEDMLIENFISLNAMHNYLESTKNSD